MSRTAQLSLLAFLVFVAAGTMTAGATPADTAAESEGHDRPRIRDLGVTPGILPPGPHNAITDVAGVRVGHRTLIRGEAVRTGVTAVVPHGGDLFRSKTPAAVWVGNGYGKAAGFLQVQELGTLETPIVLTNTLSVGRAVEAVVAWTLARPGNQEVGSVNALVGETNDSWLNDIRGFHVSAEDVVAALEGARDGAVEEGSVGAGTGTRALGFKGGIGTASRRLPPELGGYTVGALVQSNFGGVLLVDGVRVGEALGRYSFREALEAPLPEVGGTSEVLAGERLGAVPREPPDDGDGSVMVVLATDAPLSPRQLERLARRAPLGLARVGSFMANGSGDFVIAFSTANVGEDSRQRRSWELVGNPALSPLFLAVVEAVEEAVLNSLTRATTVRGRDGHVAEAIPIDALRELLADRPAASGGD